MTSTICFCFTLSSSFCFTISSSLTFTLVFPGGSRVGRQGNQGDGQYRDSSGDNTRSEGGAGAAEA